MNNEIRKSIFEHAFQISIISVLAVCLSVMLGHVSAYAESQQGNVTSSRIAGGTAEETSAAISKAAFPGGSRCAIVARSDDFADAMSATGLAGTLDCPIITTSPITPSPAMLNEVKRLGASMVYIIGGTGAVSGNVENALVAMGVKVERVSGENSWDTSTACAKAIEQNGGNTRDIIVATSNGFQDALSISSFAYKHKIPIILGTANRDLTVDARSIVSRSTGTVYVPGGVMAVPRSTAEDLVGATRVVRMAGSSGYDTSNQIATYFSSHGLLGSEAVFLATGALATQGVDALSGCALAGKRNANILLVSGNSSIEPQDTTTVQGADSEGTVAFLAANHSGIRHSTILGGNVVVSDAFVSRVDTVLSGRIDDVQVETKNGFEYAVGDYYLNGIESGRLPTGWRPSYGSSFEYTDKRYNIITGFECGYGIYVTGCDISSGAITVPGAIDGVPVVFVKLASASVSAIKLDLSACHSLKAVSLTGRYSVTFGDVREIDYFSGEDCTVPDDITQLSKLEFLDLGFGAPRLSYESLRYLSLDDINVADVTIENAPKLDSLGLDSSSATQSVTLRNCPSLVGANLLCGEMKTARIRDCASLQTLSLGNDSLVSFEITNCASLSHFQLVSYRKPMYEGKVKTARFVSCPSLLSIGISGGELNSIEIAGCDSLEILSLGDNKLKTLDLTGCPRLVSLLVPNNQLTVLDISGLSRLKILSCNGNPISDYTALQEWASEPGHSGTLF